MQHRIYVPLASNSESLREVDAIPAGDGQFRIVGAAPPGEPPRFKRGETVECEIRALPDGKKGLVAIRSMSADPEFRKRRNMFAISGALVGGVLGASAALCFEASAKAAGIGFIAGAVFFAYCSVRWGDSAWDVLSRLFRWE
jgi:hypothetical protein